MIPLFKRFPALAKSLHRMPLGNFPTPLDKLAKLSMKVSRQDLYCKRDDLSGLVYGGNKVRKLEFLFADALNERALRVITSGAAGSNHALATALYARRSGLKATLVLSEQVPSAVVRGNLLADAHAGAEMIYVEAYGDLAAAVDAQVRRYEAAEGKTPYVIPAGGSSLLGVMGYVNAALELREQIDNKVMEEPGAIVVPLGTMGTAAGLLLGIKAAGLQSKLIGVRVVPPVVANSDKFNRLFSDSNDLLKKLDPTAPSFSVEEGDFTMDHDFYEPGYGVASKGVLAAIAALLQTERISLDETYSGKAFAAFYEIAGGGGFGGRPLLFWNTKNARELPEGSKEIDYRMLPSEFHRFFKAAEQGLV